MRFKNSLLLLTVVLLTFSYNFAQRGILGDYTVSSAEEILNTFTSVSVNATNGDNSIFVSDNTLSGGAFLTDLAEGDLILIYQTQGAEVDVNTTAIGWGSDYTAQNNWSSFGGSNPEWDITEYGQVLDYLSVGYYEYAEVAGVNGSSEIILNCTLQHDYFTNQHAQVIRVPRFENLTVENNASISTLEWDGNIGGVVALEVNNNIQLTGTSEITADGKGFRGGEKDDESALASGAGGSQGYLGSFTAGQGGEKGESIYGYHTEYDNISSRFCRGAIANGGGGANFHNAGGGGGSNVGIGTFTGKGVPDPGGSNEFVDAWNLEDPNMLTNPSAGGGRGGYSHGASNQNPLTTGPDQGAWSGDFRRVTGGTGGYPLALDQQRVFMGGGGGAGDGNDDYAGEGGRGGGVVFLHVYGEISGNGSITANGAKGGDAAGNPPPQFTSQRTGDDGAGGGGGGGSVVIQNLNPIPSTIRLSAEGGEGGDQQVLIGAFGNMSCEGPGGGGAGGRIEFTSGTPQQSVAGGNGGTTNSSFVSNFSYNGATGGNVGIQNITSEFYDILPENIVLCEEVSITIDLTVVGTLPTGATIDWFTAPFGGTSFHSGSSYTTPVITSNTTYYVGVCNGSFRAPIEILVSPAINISGTPVIVAETCAGNDGEITGISVAGGEGVLTYEWNSVTYPSPGLTNQVGGDYTLTVTDENGCAESLGPLTIPPSPGPSIDLSGLTLQDETCNGNDGSITGINASGSGLVYSWNGTESPTIELNNISAGSYTLVVTDENDCEQTAGPFTIESEEGPEINADNIVITDETCVGSNGAIEGITATGTGLTYSWDNAADNTLDLSNLAAGDYTLTVTDDDNCSTQAGPFEVELNDGPTVDTSNLVITPEICGNGQGEISGIVILDPYQNLTWNSGFSNDLNIDGLTAGEFTLEVADNNGCTTTIGPLTVSNLASPVIDTSNIAIQEESCFENDGAITGISASGNGISYSWNGDSTATADLNNVPEGSYVLVVTDTNNCQSAMGPIDIAYNPGPTIDGSNVSTTNESCLGNDGSISGLTTTGSDLTYTWNGLNQGQINLENASAGTYTLVVEDQNGCSDTFGPVTIEADEVPTLDVTPDYSEILSGESVTLTTTINPADPNAEINWNPGIDLSCTTCFETTASPEESTTYTATFTTVEGCEISDTAFIFVEEQCPEVFVPTIFSPNGDGENDVLCVEGDCISDFSLHIFNRWGEELFVTQSLNDCWDGTHKNSPVNSGVVAFRISGNLIDGTTFKFGGNITIVR